ncbi:MAG: cell wall-binding repeat-containing protein, partial [Ilumatobacteraceae bacterium]|nr:cell wall-binding repeat-containing protein [Ilumatobacteraceae bacterium]
MTATVSGAASTNVATTEQGITGATAPAAAASAPAGGDAQVDVERVSGVDRYKTAATISAKAYPTTAEVVYVASGTNFPDAVSAAPSAIHENAPLLLTQAGQLPASTRAEIARLDPEKIVIVGGSGVISNAVRDALKSLAPNVVRVAGTDRYSTSIALARYAFGTAGASTAYIATGNAFPDAMSAGAAAGSSNGPVILVNGSASTADSATRSLLSDLRTSKVKVIGGTAAVSAGIATSLGSGGKTVTRLSGSDRFETSIATNANAFTSSSTVYLATGYNYPDALAGSVLAGAQPAPMFVVPTTCVPSGVLAQIDAVGATDVVLLGGTTALQTGVANLDICETESTKVVAAPVS